MIDLVRALIDNQRKFVNKSKMHEYISMILGYSFNDKNLCQMAFTHRSVRKENYERLELLGDSVLRLSITERLFEDFPDSSEGEISREIQNIVNKKILTEISEKYNLITYLESQNLRLEDSNLRSAISADLVESLIGAIFLDSDYLTVRNIIFAMFELELTNIEKIGLKDSKTLLQEYCQHIKISLPKYTTEKLKSSDHKPVFNITCSIEINSISVTSKCNNVREGQQLCSSKILEQLKKNEETKHINNRKK